MILGVGTDIVKIERFTNSRDQMDRLANKILTDRELGEYSLLTCNHDNFLAKRWAAKEAISKSFGTGIKGSTTWKNIEIRHSDSGRPLVYFHETLTKHQLNCHLSLSDDDETVIAYCVLEFNN